jgi:hypothetical protein
MTFKEQSKKWEAIVLSHVSRAIALVHDFIVKVLENTIPDNSIREALWDDVLCEKVLQGYERAMGHARFLLDVELGGRPYTYDAYFAANLQKRRLERFEDEFHRRSTDCLDGNGGTIATITIDSFRKFTIDNSNTEQAREEIHDGSLRSLPAPAICPLCASILTNTEQSC